MAALKEWSIVCKALEDGIQTILLRKGGILEYKNGFEVKHDFFFLYPTYEHQSEEYIKPVFLNTIILDQPQDKLQNKITCFAKVEEVREIHDHSVFSSLDKYHVWNEKFINSRIKYNPNKPINVILLRAYKLANTIMLDVKKEWSGCKSWIDLEISEYSNSYFNSVENNLLCNPVIDDLEFKKIAHEFKELWN